MLNIRTLFICGILVFTQIGGLYAQVQSAQKPDEASFDEAFHLFEKEQFGNAQEIWDALLRESTLDNEKLVQARYFSVMCAIKLYHGDIAERIEEFANIHETNPLRYKLYLSYSHNLFSLRRYSQAINYYEKVAAYGLNKEQLGEYRFKYAYSLMIVEDFDAAKDLFFKIKDEESAFANSGRYYYAHLLYVDSSYSEALRNFLPLQEDPNFGPLVPYYLAHIYYQLENYDKLVEVGEELIENATASRAPEIAKLLADAFYSKKDYLSTINYLNIFKAKGGSLRLYDHYQFGFSLYQEKRFAEAIPEFNKISAGPEKLRQNAYFHLADSYLKVGDKNQALIAFRAASQLEVNPEIGEMAAYNYALLSYELASPFTDAISTFNAFIIKYPQTDKLSKIQEYLANIYITTKDYDKALKAIKDAGLDSPIMRVAYQKVAFFRATEMFNALQFEGALNKYAEMQKYPEDKALANLGNYWMAECYYRLLKYAEAKSKFDEFRQGFGASIQNIHNRSYYNSAYCNFKLFVFEDAILDFKNFVKFSSIDDMRYPDALLRIGDSYLLNAKYLDAADYYGKAITNNSVEADYAHFQRSECFGLLAKYDDQVKELNKLIYSYPYSAYSEKSQLEIAKTYLLQDKYQETLKALSDFKAKYPKSTSISEVKLKTGLVYSNMDKYEKAILSFKEVVNEYPGTPESIEAIRLAEIVYKRSQQISEYLDWVSTISFVDFKESTLDSTAYDAAFDVYAGGDCMQSLQAMNAYIGRFPLGIFKVPANYYAAQCAEKLELFSRAEEYYEQLVQLPSNPYSKPALRFTAEKAYLDSNYALARQRFQLWLEMETNEGQIILAYAGLMHCAEKLGDIESLMSYSQSLELKPTIDKYLKEEAQLNLARSYFTLEKWNLAAQYYAYIRESSAGEKQAEAYYFEALLLQIDEKHDSSNTHINKMIEALPSFKEWKMRSLLLMARNFWRLDDIFQAQYVIDFIIDSEFSGDLSSAAQDLRQEINLAEAQAIKEKEDLLQAQASPISLDPESGLQIIDVPEKEEPLEEPELIKR
ncbi:MAG: tetratricopeptide (TPR) repeat protein [Roseivirga sp.]|jgi:tetratricopeptide (TPR) repeat protein